MMEVMPVLAGAAVVVLVVVVVVGVCGGAGRGEGEEKSLEWEGEGDEAAEGGRALPASSATAAAVATMTGGLPLPVLVPRCVLEPLCDLDKNKRRLGFLRGDVVAGGGAPSDDEVKDEEEADEEADEEDGREGAVEGVAPNPSVDRTRCIVLRVLCGLIFSPRASTTKAWGPSDWISSGDREKGMLRLGFLWPWPGSLRLDEAEGGNLCNKCVYVCG